MKISKEIRFLLMDILIAWGCWGQTAAPAVLKSIEVLRRDEKAEVEIVTITSDGFYPRKLSRGTGPFVLFIEKRAQIKGELDLRLESESKSLAKGLKIKDREIETGELVRLPVGIYTLTLTGKSKYSFTLEIKAK